MTKRIRVVAFLLCICMLFSACNGKKEVEEGTTAPQGTDTNAADESFTITDGKITLPYNRTDGLNPFFAKSYENLYLCSLLYDPLFKVDGKYVVSGGVAESISFEDNIAIVRIGTNNSTSNGNINANDVVYSFNLAKNSHGWGNDLKGISFAETNGDFTVRFTLDIEDVYVAGKLTFPIVKEGTANAETDIPTGSGDYMLSGEKLTNKADSSRVIELASISDRQSAEDAFNIGTTDVFFNDLSDCDYSVASGKITDVPLSNMVYLGINSNRGGLNNYIRNAIAAKIDSEQIVLSAFQGHARAFKLPLSPESTLANEVNKINTASDKVLADNIIDRAGYTRYSGNAKTNGAYSLAFTLIVNKENRYRIAAAYNIADSLAESGFMIDVLVLTFEEYSQRIAAGNYDLYLGEVKLDGSMDISQFFIQGTPFSNGINKSEPAATDYFKYRAGEITADQYYSTFAEYYPFVPIAFRSGYTVTSNDVNLTLADMPFGLYGGI